jgi:peptidyl-prolyl cis-trans isomerase SurA
MKRQLSAIAILLAAAGPAAAQVTTPVPDSASPPAAAPAEEVRDAKVNWIVAVVGEHPILWSDVVEVINQRRAQGLRLPPDSAGQVAIARQVLNELVDEDVLLLKAKEEKLEVADAELATNVDRQLKRIRDQFKTEVEFRDALRREGFGTPEEYRKTLTDQARRAALQQRVIDKLRQDGKLVPVAVSEADVTTAFEQNRATLPRRPATVTFRQVIVAPKPSEAAKAAARAKAESLLVELRGGADFEQLAKRESMDPSNKDIGGDLGWNRRGVMVPEFDRWMFALPPNQLSPVVETSFGFHIIRVDRVQPAEVKARHILIRPKVDSADVARARALADSVATVWRGGVSHDSLAARHHDPAEYKSLLDPFPREQLPAPYQAALEGKATGDITDPFPIEDRASGLPKFVVAQLVSQTEGGEYTIADLRTTFRDQLAQERSIRRLLDTLRKDVYVSIRM